jgi:hypothetical protein
MDGIDEFVKEYLISKGYSKTVAELMMESSRKHNSTGNLITTQQVPTSIVNSRLLSTIVEDIYVLGYNGNVYIYFSSYDAVRSWALNALDQVKYELLSITFPLFVYWFDFFNFNFLIIIIFYESVYIEYLK